MRIIVTGSKGSGKSTLCHNIIKALNWKAGGFMTHPVIKDGLRIGFDLFPLENGLSVTPGFPLARIKPSGKFQINSEAFDSIGIKAIERGLKGDNDCMIIDEIGRFEKNNISFLNTVWQAILQNQTPVLVVLKKENLPFNQKVWELSEGIHVDLDLITREEAFQMAVAYFKKGGKI